MPPHFAVYITLDRDECPTRLRCRGPGKVQELGEFCTQQLRGFRCSGGGIHLSLSTTLDSCRLLFPDRSRGVSQLASRTFGKNGVGGRSSCSIPRAVACTSSFRSHRRQEARFEATGSGYPLARRSAVLVHPDRASMETLRMNGWSNRLFDTDTQVRPRLRRSCLLCAGQLQLWAAP